MVLCPGSMDTIQTGWGEGTRPALAVDLDRGFSSNPPRDTQGEGELGRSVTGDGEVDGHAPGEILAALMILCLRHVDAPTVVLPFQGAGNVLRHEQALGVGKVDAADGHGVRLDQGAVAAPEVVGGCAPC